MITAKCKSARFLICLPLWSLMLPTILAAQISSSRIVHSEFPRSGAITIGPAVGSPLSGGENGDIPFGRIVGGALLSDGSFVVADAGASLLHLFASNGTSLWSRGGRGQGPGEFSGFQGLWVVEGDSIMAFDRGQQRISVFSADGNLSRVRMTRYLTNMFETVGPLSNGAWFAREVDQNPGSAVGSVVRDTITFRQLTANLVEGPVIGVVPGARWTAQNVFGQLGSRTAPMTPYARHGALRSCLVFAESEAFDIRVVNGQGELVLHIANPWPARSVTAAIADLWRAEMLAPVPVAERPLALTILEQIPMPESLPAYHSLAIDDEDNVWLGLYEPPFGIGSEWIVLSLSGAPPIHVRFPRQGEILAVRNRIILFSTTSPLGEPIILRYPVQTAPTRDPSRIPAACGAGS